MDTTTVPPETITERTLPWTDEERLALLHWLGDDQASPAPWNSATVLAQWSADAASQRLNDAAPWQGDPFAGFPIDDDELPQPTVADRLQRALTLLGDLARDLPDDQLVSSARTHLAAAIARRHAEPWRTSVTAPTGKLV